MTTVAEPIRTVKIPKPEFLTRTIRQPVESPVIERELVPSRSAPRESCNR